MALKLSTGALSKLNNVRIPTYDRTKLSAGILHIGVGNFHRSHMAAYMDDLFEKDMAANSTWGVVGAGIMSFDDDKRKLLEPQQWMQTLVQRDANTTSASVVSSMIDFLPVEVKAIQEALRNPGIKIVSMTVTEGGYFLNNGKFDTKHPQVAHDISTFGKEPPQTIFGIIVQALKERKDANQPAFTVMSCDNIPHNGSVVKEAVTGMAAQVGDPSLAQWIDEKVFFPNSMVDRITPATTDEQRKFVADNYDLQDASPIFCEPFRQWVLEDHFSDGRPDWDQLENVIFTENVAPYEFMKIRILNGGHASLCYPSALLGLPYVHSAMEHAAIGPFLDALEKNEIIPTVPPVPNTVLSDYWEIIADRFSNPTLNDTIGRNCFDGASRQPKFIIPVIADNLKAGRSVDGLAVVSALWCRYCQGKTQAGETIAANDPQWDRLQKTALLAAKDPAQWLAMTDVYGDVGTDPVFLAAFSKALNTIQDQGVEAALNQYVASKA